MSDRLLGDAAHRDAPPARGVAVRRAAGMAATIRAYDHAKLHDLITDEQVLELAAPVVVAPGTDLTLLKLALVHSSARNEHILLCGNELLCWAGQTFLRSALSAIGLRDFPEHPPAVFAQLVDAHIQPEPVAALATARGLADAVVLGGSMGPAGRHVAKVRAQALEAFLGALYETTLHASCSPGAAWEAATTWLESCLAAAGVDLAERADEIAKLAKTQQPAAAAAAAGVRARDYGSAYARAGGARVARGPSPARAPTAPSGPVRFTSTVRHEGAALAQGRGNTKAAAEQAAARAAMEALQLPAGEGEANFKGRLQEHFQRRREPLPAYVTTQNFA